MPKKRKKEFATLRQTAHLSSYAQHFMPPPALLYLPTRPTSHQVLSMVNKCISEILTAAFTPTWYSPMGATAPPSPPPHLPCQYDVLSCCCSVVLAILIASILYMPGWSGSLLCESFLTTTHFRPGEWYCLRIINIRQDANVCDEMNINVSNIRHHLS